MLFRQFFCKMLSKHLWQLIFIKILYFQHILLNTFRRMSLMYENYTLRRILTIQTIFTLCKSLVAKTLGEITIKWKLQPLFRYQRTELLFLVLSQPDLPTKFDFAGPFFFFFLRARSASQIKLRARKIGRVEVNLSSPVTTSSETTPIQSCCSKIL